LFVGNVISKKSGQPNGRSGGMKLLKEISIATQSSVALAETWKKHERKKQNEFISKAWLRKVGRTADKRLP